jgi:hypothetical protein
MIIINNRTANFQQILPPAVREPFPFIFSASVGHNTASKGGFIMKNKFLPVLPVLASLLILSTGCNQKGQMNAKSVQDATTQMAKNESVQRAFSDGRIHVMSRDRQARRTLLQNTMNEQSMMMEDPQLRAQFLKLNIHTNRMMTNDPSGREQLSQSTLTVLEGMNNDPGKLRRFAQIQSELRKKAVGDENLRKTILQQNVREQSLALSHPSTSGDVLKHNIQAFSAISAAPALRSQMADSMLPLLKDPKIAAELEKMIQLAVAKEAKKMQSQMKAQMQAQMKAQIQAQTKAQMQRQAPMQQKTRQPASPSQQNSESETAPRR